MFFSGLIYRLSTGIPGYGLHTEMILKFFPINWKFPECCSRITEQSGIPEHSGNFWNVIEYHFGKFSEKLFWNFPEQDTRITL